MNTLLKNYFLTLQIKFYALFHICKKTQCVNSLKRIGFYLKKIIILMAIFLNKLIVPKLNIRVLLEYLFF